MKNNVIPVFYACDDNFIKYVAVSIKSIIKNSDKNYFYRFYILNTGVSDKYRDSLIPQENENYEIIFSDVTDKLKTVTKSLPLRDYYSKTTYFRLFISDMFPEYDKVIYIDGDTVAVKDISELYLTDIKDNYVGAVREKVMADTEVFGNYVEKVLGIDRYAYFNAGILLINSKKFREKQMLSKFCSLLSEYDFVVTQDEDYLNLMFKDRVTYLDPAWNAEIYNGLPCAESDVAVFHYIMTSKPWRYENCDYGKYFWQYAEETPFYDEIKSVLNNYTDAERERDRLCGENLIKLAEKEIARDDNYLKNLRKRQNAERVEILSKISALEKNGKFDVDVENDPPCKPLPDNVDYTRKKFFNKLKAKYAFSAARKFMHTLIQNGQMTISGIIGAENLEQINGGAIITLNHFNAYDSFAAQLVYECCDTKKHKFYRVIREGNYTSFGGFYGYLMRNCNTLPLSSDTVKMRKFYSATKEILNDNGFILIYAEQSMWWNYRKPKPLKKGAFSIAAINNVPIVPCFITMRDGDITDENGFPVQEYTIHVCKPVYPKSELTCGQNAVYMKAENERVWKEIYEKFYGIPLRYETATAGDPI